MVLIPLAVAADAGPAERGPPNRLAGEKSPYLLAHAHDPVDWYPWGEEAFARARADDKPIFLSVGYSTCHWCHVMQRESFRDEEVAALLNEHFVCVKVDREERPDVDHVYMAACQLMTGGGGWPLTVVMTPDGRPFFAGTYFPREARFGRAGMLELVPRVAELWATRRDELLATSNEVVGLLERTSFDSGAAELDEAALAAAFDRLRDNFDQRHGGFGAAPKFPTPHNFYFLLRYGRRTGEGRAREMVEESLAAMRRGGIYDHVGFGFHRYATDAAWRVPHFEKMLYDQALLATAYVEAYQATGDEDYARTAREVFAYILRDMTAPEGAFYAAEDADSEGVEGKFYLWTERDIREVLNGDEAGLIIDVFNVEAEGNFAEAAAAGPSGANVLFMDRPLSEVAAERGVPEDELRGRLEAAREKLFRAREGRVRPGRDDKILTDWNGLMVAALAKGARAFDEPAYADAAARAAAFILAHMADGDGRLYHRYRDGEAAVAAFLDDYAFLTWGLLELYEATFDARYLRAALELARTTVDLFWDERNGGFFYAAADAEDLIVRRKEVYDGATPSGNAVAALNLLRLARLTGDTSWEEKAAATTRAFSGTVAKAPASFPFMMTAPAFALGPSYEVVVVGDAAADDTQEMLRALARAYVPNAVVAFKPAGDDESEIVELAEYTRDLSQVGGRATAYVCEGFSCRAPTHDVAEMLASLGAEGNVAP
ncbi:MAG TPA: thioredoxin domain-containing protein [bacterium]|nr:thioredoxin domain-containing protein [bacterium]